MNPSALFTYARALIPWSVSPLSKKSRGGNERLSSARHSLFPRACFIFRIFFLFCSALHLLSYTLYLEPLAALSHREFIQPSLLSHRHPITLIHFLHCLICISKLSANRFLQFRYLFIPQVSLAFSRFFKFCKLTCGKSKTTAIPAANDNLEIFLTHSTLGDNAT